MDYAIRETFKPILGDRTLRMTSKTTLDEDPKFLEAHEIHAMEKGTGSEKALL